MTTKELTEKMAELEREVSRLKERTRRLEQKVIQLIYNRYIACTED